ncbi:pseudomurein-binding repeat-containing protein [Methanobrevibacter curvatus]|uniref:Peptidase C39-like domain-containing protein n=1 Tax=Methanobrevibacter curvatus TaxID=49547 RepID=A0A166CAP4_9EURY|nr:pseudomurein-binding repeat-containing protein [Methanobrevibacter curvatus]KZX14308.1 hypothetical protein MBCUR_05320 [Methanobrevibacter curvatus]
MSTVSWEQYSQMVSNVNIFKAKNKRNPNTVTIPEITKPKPGIAVLEYSCSNWNQRNFPKSNSVDYSKYKKYSAYVCGNTAFANLLKCLKMTNWTYDEIVKTTIPLFNTRVGIGTVPPDFTYGVQKTLAKYYPDYRLVTTPFDRKNFIKTLYELLKKSPVIVNLETDKTIGYNNRYGHYSLVSGVDKDKGLVKFLDSNHIPGIPAPKWYKADVIARLIEMHGKRPLWTIVKK